jgi:hypothetical protein
MAFCVTAEFDGVPLQSKKRVPSPSHKTSENYFSMLTLLYSLLFFSSQKSKSSRFRIYLYKGEEIVTVNFIQMKMAEAFYFDALYDTLILSQSRFLGFFTI